LVVISAYAYCAVDILVWWARLRSNGNEGWEPVFGFFGVAFLPLDLLVLAVCRVVWGTSNFIEAKPILGLMEDVSLASVFSTTVLLVPLLAVTSVLSRIEPLLPTRCRSRQRAVQQAGEAIVGRGVIDAAGTS
jgi:hypothetical protein